MPGRSGGRRPPDGLFDLPSLAPLPTAAERAADVIRENIFEGRFRPGSPLPETSLAHALGVSRNTVREAFRALINEHLLTYQPHKGVAVRRLTADDVRDIYAVRRTLELSAIDALAAGTSSLDEAALADTLAAGDRAAGADDWGAAGTANLRFHTQLVAVHASPRMAEFFHRLMTEMRLGFLALDDPRAFHEPYLARNHDLANLLRAGSWDRARTTLDRYLDEAGGQVLGAVAGRPGDGWP